MTLLQDLVDAVSLGSLYALCALSVAVIFGVARIVNFANAELITVAAYGLVLLVSPFGPFAIFGAIALSALVALLMYLTSFRFMADAPLSTLMVASLALSLLVQNLLLMIMGARARPLTFGSSLGDPVSIGSLRVAKVDLLTIAVTLVLVAGLAVLFRATRVGFQLRAAAEDFQMARLVGVRAGSVVAGTFVLSGVLAGVSGILVSVKTGSVTPDLGTEPIIVGFIATVIGGLGSIAGSATGGFLLGAATALLQAVLPDSVAPFRDVAVFLVVILILLTRPQGLFSSAAVEERA
jgi:branched-chain amino acid transport system permease protein